MDSTPAAPSSLWENVLDEDGLATANLLGGNSGADTEIDNIMEITLPKPLLVQQTQTVKTAQAAHWKSYESWCKKNSFLSMLPRNTKKHKQQKADTDRQSQLDLHLWEREKKETKGIAYSNELFRQVAVEWLIATNQPLSALEHPKFQDMIYVAAKATNGVKIPACKQTRQEIIDMFKHQMNHLRAKLNGPTVQGLVSLTCDAWQASNSKGYLTITGSWVCETTPGEWKEESGLVGFVQMNNAHNGKCLGKAMYKLVQQLGIAHN
ncbi:hypothetical protein C0991_006565, partial [Blastosporella zonata]